MRYTDREILLVLPMAYQDGIDKYNGIMRYMSEHKLQWHIVLNRLSLSYATVKLADLHSCAGIISDGGVTLNTAKTFIVSRLPLVAIDWRHPDLGNGRRRFIRIDSDPVAIARIAAETFLDIGHFASFVYFPYLKGISWSDTRGENFRNMLERHSLELTILESRQSLEKQLRALPKPAAILAANDFAANKLLGAARRAGCAIPEDISVLGVDNDRYICLHSRPPLASIQPSFEEAGYLAAEALSALLENKPVPRQMTYHVTDIALRESLEPPGTAGAFVRLAIRAIKDSSSRFKNITELARHLGCSRRLLDKRFRQIEGRSVLDAIQDRRMEIIMEQLRSTDLPIRTICENSPFKSISYPMRLFKKRYSMTMRTWRMLHRQKQ